MPKGELVCQMAYQIPEIYEFHDLLLVKGKHAPAKVVLLFRRFWGLARLGSLLGCEPVEVNERLFA